MIDPASGAPGQPNAHLMQDNIRMSLHAFRDENRDRSLFDFRSLHRRRADSRRDRRGLACGTHRSRPARALAERLSAIRQPHPADPSSASSPIGAVVRRCTRYNIIAIPLAAEVLVPAGIRLSPAAGAVLMSLSTVIVAVNAQLLRRARL